MLLNSPVRAWRLLGLFLLIAATIAATAVLSGGDSERAQGATAKAELPPDDFYQRPNPVPEGKPGDIIRSRKVSPGSPTNRELADTWQVMYLSKDAQGKPVANTGTVMVPKGKDPATLPIIGWGPGTQGPAFRCTPSRMIAKGALYEQWVINDMLKQGQAVAIPDYEGTHPEPKTTYMTGKSLGPALVDVVRASQKLSETKLSADAKVVYRGYSQGGGAALWAGEVQPEYAPEQKVVGIVAGGVPGHMVDLALALNGSPASGFLFNALAGLDNAYPELNMEGSLNDAGKAAMAEMTKSACALELIHDYANKSVTDYFTGSPLTSAPWKTAYRANTLGGTTAIKVPVFQYHGTTDSIVDAAQADDLHKEYCGHGLKLTWKTYETGDRPPIQDHLWPIQAGNADASAYVADRLAGKDATSNCE
ncbi:lipase [Streptomyces sp. A7024]|uniref:Lipase n=1 Tax=Streptomyces coryli TaxID=1128680 RepID=A0A6G4UCJ4_9ACTN|nr:lipase family protein [Streptomyces coryli]NGN69732.1 lipase [Streptomyces coryli]